MSYELIETVEVGSGGAASIEFTSIPQDGTDLVLKYSLRTDTSPSLYDIAIISFNSSSANFTIIELEGTGLSVFSRSQSAGRGGDISGAGTTANTFSSGQIYVSNYASSNAKSFSVDMVTENNGTDGKQMLIAGSWDDTSAISSVSFASNDSADFVTGSSISLYKITAA